MIDSVKNFVTYTTFGKQSRLLELLIGSFLLGGVSISISFIDRASVQIAAIITVLSLSIVCYVCIRIGNKTLSPILNSEIYTIGFGVLQFIFIGLGVSTVYLATEPTTSLPSIKILVLASVFTVFYILIINRTTSMSFERKKCKRRLSDLAKQMDEYQSATQVSISEAESLRDNLEDIAKEPPATHFPDEDDLFTELYCCWENLDDVDPKTLRRIVSGEHSDDDFKTEKYEETINRYENVMGKVRGVGSP